MFNLDERMAAWRQSLLAREAFTPDCVRELEVHVRDAITDLTSKGLSEDEAVWIATRRLGPAEALAAEFEKVDPGRLWRQRIFWMAFGLLLSHVVFHTIFAVGKLAGWLAAIIGAERPDPYGTIVLILPLLIEMLAIAVLGGLGFLLAKGKLNRPIDGIASRYKKRSTLALLVFGLVLASAVLEYFWSQVLTTAPTGGILRNPGWWGLYWQFVNSIYPMIVALVVVWLAPLRPANA